MSPTITDPRTHALEAFARALSAAASALYPDAPAVVVGFESPRRASFGDFATNVAFSLAKFARRSPQDVALALVERVRETEACHAFVDVDAVAGFINLRLAPSIWQAELARLAHDGGDTRRTDRSGRISLEFGSANPTGPLVVVQGRSLSIGDALARAMRYCGYDVFTEWIINDAGAQMQLLGESLYARYRQIETPDFPFPEEGYPGQYLVDIAQTLRERDGTRWNAASRDEWLPYFQRFARDTIVEQQQLLAERFGVRYDLWQSELELHERGTIQGGIDGLQRRGLTYESEGAIFVRTTDFGDDKDRVVVRSDGRPTYYALDVSYHDEKLGRADRVIDILGPDHHGYVGRLNALATALGRPGCIDVLISGQITLVRDGQPVKMSKRAGQIEMLETLLDEVGNDAARFFFVMLSPESPLNFDLSLAVAHSNDNPVYYVQYGHARIASVLRNAGHDVPEGAPHADTLSVLTMPTELQLIRRLVELPSIVQGVVDHLAPHRLARYARDVASDFHAFYTECKILTDDATTRRARLALCVATKSVLATSLHLLGVSAPESM
jgi:arginyl-tRNA synthetase